MRNGSKNHPVEQKRLRKNEIKTTLETIDKVLDIKKWAENIKTVQDELIKLAIIVVNNSTSIQRNLQLSYFPSDHVKRMNHFFNHRHVYMVFRLLCRIRNDVSPIPIFESNIQCKNLPNRGVGIFVR